MSSAHSKILDDLNDAQRRAVVHPGGPLLVVAGAGSGKTRVITRRVAYLVHKGVPAWSILAVTFTNKAAGEMKWRIEGLVSKENLWVSTFHSFCARFLRIEGDHLGSGYDGSFSIFDADDSQRLMRKLLKQEGVEPKKLSPAAVCAVISNFKNAMVAPEDVSLPGHDGEIIARLYEAMQAELRKMNALDFDDLLLKTVELLEAHSDIRGKWSDRFHHVLVDEYQDTNRAQYLIARTLSGHHRNICATGDPDQSIYGWRGAEINNILDFTSDFPDATIIRLEENYRSTRHILVAADKLIQNNELRIERGLTTTRSGGVPVRLLVAATDEHEAELVASRIAAAVKEGRRKYQDFAIFYRTNAQSRLFEEEFVALAVPYSVIAGVAFYERKEVKDALAYLRLVVNPSDEIAFVRAANVPKRGLGQITLGKIAARAAEEHVTAAELVCREGGCSFLSSRARKGVDDLRAVLTYLGAMDRSPVRKLVRAAVRKSGLRESLSSEEDRQENLDELVRAGAEFDEKNPGVSLQQFLEQVALITDLDSWDDKADRASLMTLHASKGLEFPAVFVTGVEHGLLPHSRSLLAGTQRDIEEERRLLYVGMTRAMDELTLTHARKRRTMRGTGISPRSRFIGELPLEDFEVEDLSSDGEEIAGERPAFASRRDGVQRRYEGANEYEGYRWKPWHPPAEPTAKKEGIHREYDQAFTNPYDIYPGDEVVHKRFGRGTVEDVDGTGENACAVVRFERGGRKRLVLEYAGLEKIF